MRKLNLKYDKENIKNFCNSNHIKKLAVFGSFVKSNLTESSDLDLLVEFTKDTKITLLKFCEIERNLISIFDGVKSVDLVTKDSISPYLKNEILDSCVTIYEN